MSSKVSNSEIIDTYLRTKGLVRVKGDSFEPMLPLLMVDAQYQIYDKIIRPIKARHKLKAYKKVWHD